MRRPLLGFPRTTSGGSFCNLFEIFLTFPWSIANTCFVMSDFQKVIPMKPSDRRLARRFRLTIPLFIRGWKTMTPEQEVKSVNVSEIGVYFETDVPPPEGSMVQVRLSMPMEITGGKTVEWRCTGKVVGVRPTGPPGTSLGV